MQNLSQIGPVVSSVEGGAIDLAPAHLLLRAHLYMKLRRLVGENGVGAAETDSTVRKWSS